MNDTALKDLVETLPPEVDGVLITSPVNRRYYTGFPSSAGVILATRKGCRFIIDSRYHEAACRTVTSCEVLLQKALYAQIGELLRADGVRCLALENRTTSVRELSDWKKQLPDVTLLCDDSLTDLIENQRRRKSPEELSCIRQAQAITDKAFAYILDYIKAGRTEQEIALELEFFCRRHGSEGVPFEYIVVSGKNSSMPHGVPTGKPVEEGDFITMDFGAVVNGYCSDMTRTVALGYVSDRQRAVYETVLAAQNAAFPLIKAGAECVAVDRAARELIDAEYKDMFGHGLGHALGLEVHENPGFNTRTQAVLQVGDVLSVEPGIYLPGEFGVRIEDIVAVMEDGYENLTKSRKELIVL